MGDSMEKKRHVWVIEMFYCGAKEWEPTDGIYTTRWRARVDMRLIKKQLNMKKISDIRRITKYIPER